MPLYCKHTRQAFSLVELLVVIAIMAVLGAVSLPAIKGITQSRQLANGATMVGDMVQLARQNSASRNSLTALVLVTRSSTEPELNYRLLNIAELLPGATAWMPIGKWQILPKGIIIDFTAGASASFTDAANQPPLGVPLTITRNGTVLDQSKCSYQIFQPDGGLKPSTNSPPLPPKLRLVEGSFSGTNIVYTSMSPANGPGNYYDIYVNVYTGLAKIERP